MIGYRDLTIPNEGSESARQVLSEALGSLLGDFRRLEATRLPEGQSREAFVMLRRAVAKALKANPGPVFSALRRPTVGVLIRSLRQGPEAPSDRFDALTATFGLELARAGALVEPLVCPRVARVPCLSGRFVVDVDEDVQAMHITNDALTLVSRTGSEERTIRDAMVEKDAPQNSPYHVLDDEIVLALFDNNPLALEEAHPDKDGNAVSLGEHPIEEWIASLREALAIIGTHLPETRAEIGLLIQQIVPVGYFAERHLSASFQEAIGTIYLSLHPQPMTMAEALIHEMSHNKLNALLEKHALLDNSFSPLFSSPVRPDPRPLHGVLLAVHAFLPVARLYEKMIEADHPWSAKPDFQKRFAQIVALNRDAASTLRKHGQFSEVGAILGDEIQSWDRYFSRLSPPQC